MSSSDLCLALYVDDEKTLTPETSKAASACSKSNQEIPIREAEKSALQIDNRLGQYGQHGDHIGTSYDNKPEEIAIPVPNIHPKPSDIIDWDSPNDPNRPCNWPVVKRSLFTVTTSVLLFAVSFGSAVFLPATEQLAGQLGTSSTVMHLTTSLWLIGFSFGPIIFAPQSPAHGHRGPLFFSMLGLCTFQIPTAIATNTQTLLISRFFAGVFGSGVLVVVPGMCAELYRPPVTHSIVFVASGVSILIGATTAPIAGAYLYTQGRTWGWLAWTTLVIGASVGVVGLVTLPESSSGILLRRKATLLRVQTGNWALHSKSEEVTLDTRALAYREYFTKPIQMFAAEPLLVFMTIYVALTCGTFYLALQIIPRVFQQRGWLPSTASLPLIAVVLGVLTSGGLFTVFTMTWYRKRTLRREGLRRPEDRLLPMLSGAVILPASLLWFGWSMNTHSAAQVMACYFAGAGLTLTLVSGPVYIADVYDSHRNSALAGHFVVCCLVTAAFPLWAGPLYASLGVQWASSVLAFVFLAMIPVLGFFVLYGARVRSRSRYTSTM
ncbi:major facilitator superfamily domain-containing protein [Cercophora scortea]|uniref:Major facilitator superfamily domain-containing protein n=1 Tax=Cercophora scortea TaxID=314031 RepID=A0AAE0M3D6_9PEZI|nr:major facilitator superfamily domain-containing protein [Cercophora scortea]